MRSKVDEFSNRPPPATHAEHEKLILLFQSSHVIHAN